MKILYYLLYIVVCIAFRNDFIWSSYLWLHSHSENHIGFAVVLFWYEKKLRSNNSWIGYKCKISNKPHFPHGISGIFISHEANIGNDCVIYQQVTIGSNKLRTSHSYGAPTVGDNVLIGAGAKIIGNCKIGNNVHIGANCSVVKNIPNNAVVVPMTRVLERNNH